MILNTLGALFFRFQDRRFLSIWAPLLFRFQVQHRPVALLPVFFPSLLRFQYVFWCHNANCLTSAFRSAIFNTFWSSQHRKVENWKKTPPAFLRTIVADVGSINVGGSRTAGKEP